MQKKDTTPDLIHLHTTTYESDKELNKILNFFENPPLIYTAHAILKYLSVDRNTRDNILNGREFTLKEGVYSNEEAQEKIIEDSKIITLISDTHKSVFNRIYPKHSHKTIPIPNFTNFYEFFKKNKNKIIEKSKEIREKYQKNDENLFSYCGRLEEYKGIRRLMKYWNNIVKKHPSSKLLVIGGVKEEEREEETKNRLCERYGLDRKHKNSISATKWIHNQTELASHLKASDALIQPVMSPNLYGIAALEALCTETPLITCKGELSFGNTLTEESTIEAIERLKNKPKVNIYLENAKKILKEKYSEEAFINKISKVYEESLNQKHLAM